ncbi:hypothetical protein OOT33_13700 [Sphingobium sp. DEHP117]|uniref:hypothetical protein n=1 Tax=Sphingobium sp. DEHP117 TaxID=2993436 RepID=UPI0027D4CA30|nr:hypothetical protein [Sphingobium sp. DEHP117]MDQ4421477.1 hypothetical protein [Sphingobium sp. DEHP117]
MIPALLRRIGDVVQGLLIVIDIAVCYIWLAPLYLVGLADRPTGRQMISSYVGRAALNGHRWARIAARVIDAVMGKSHCILMANRYAGFAD